MGLSDSSLGRNLSEVLAKTVRRDPPKGYLEVDIGLLSPSKTNPRTEFNEAALAELGQSIATHGILQPIVVLRRDVGYEILSGERRYRAALLAGLARVPVVVRDEEDPQHLAELRLIENLQRADLSPLEVARAYQALIDQHQLTHDEVASRVNKDRSSVTNSLRVLTLPAEIQALLAEGALSVGHAKALLAIADPVWQLALAQKAAAEQMSVRTLEQLARLGPPQGAAAAPAPAKPAHIAELESNLKLLFGTTVTVKEKAGGKGTMTLHFHSRDHFQRVVAIMERFCRQSQ